MKSKKNKQDVVGKESNIERKREAQWAERGVGEMAKMTVLSRWSHSEGIERKRERERVIARKYPCSLNSIFTSPSAQTIEANLANMFVCIC